MIAQNPIEIESPGIPANMALQVSNKIDMGGVLRWKVTQA